MDNKTALLVIDIQKGLFERANPIYQADDFLATVNALIDRARRAGVPVIYIQHSNQRELLKGSDAWQLHPDLHPPEGEPVIHKLHGNAFQKTALDDELKSLGVESLVVTGLVTHGCVQATCTGALELGYRVTLVSDGHSNFHKQPEKIIREWSQKMSEKGVELQPSEKIFSASPPG